MDPLNEIAAVSPMEDDKVDIEAQPTDSSASSFKNGSADPNPFLDADLAPYLEPIKQYEGYHRFDPKATWTQDEEKRIVRKIDLRIMCWTCIMFFALQLDRGNLSFALTDNMLTDLNLSTNDYNNGNMIFYLCFLTAEVPSQLVSKRLGPDRWLPIQMSLWSVVAMSQAALNGKASFFVTRGLLGVMEGGFIPDMVLFLSYFYKGKELPVRLSFFWTASTLTTIVSAFMAYGILHMRGVNGLAGWRYLFLIEGGVTLIVGLLSFGLMPPSPTQTASWFRGRAGWFSPREEVIMVNRILRDDPTKGDMHNRQAITPKLIWQCFTDYHSWPIYLEIGLTGYIPTSPPGAYLTLTLKALGFGTFNSNLLTIPSSVLFIINLLLVTQLSRRVNERSFVSAIGNLWSIPLLVALAVLPDTANSWVRYVILTLLLGYPYVHAIVVGWASWTAGSVRLRTVSAAMYNVCVQAGNVISSHIYQADDAPYYHSGNRILIGLAVYNVALFVGTKAFYMWVNAERAKVWDAMTREEKAHYLATTEDKGNKRLDFRFVH
ncbi:MFS general substrate transporter [Dacryopinax primogenitus]|uniref:MFS general substrate transporter n=1 Tax=Dacryopinax primogenitus (strain DJM 731) TaxID=1858805 RepID=M5FV94_DACPD|nr:MFS general substrate transporter [Dacryopinax primogenitus]EJT97231.1 MFS general substrate transporter [Dacryopinax primogenitus]